MVDARLIGALTAAWGLTITGPSVQGPCSTLVPVAGAHGEAVLKIEPPDSPIRDELRALTAWGGEGAVRLLAADPSRSALLLERLEPRDLGPPVGTIDACEEIGRLAAALDRPAPSWLKDRASDSLRALAGTIDAIRTTTHALPRRLLERGRALALDLAGEPEVDARLVHAQLHQSNVLWRPDPGEWVAISPHPVAAEPAWVVAPVLWHRWDAVVSAYDVRAHLNFRLDLVSDAAGIDTDRARVVSELRVLSNAVEQVQRGGADLAEQLTRHVTIIKALQPA